MKAYSHLKRKIRQRMEILEETLRELEELGALEGEAGRRWRTHLAGVGRSIEDFVLRVAVVGSVKSGKSTLINALVGSDLLRRGAGIVTSFVTRIRTSDRLGGWVEIKPWSQIIEELNDSARMLPDFEGDGNHEPVDIRRAEDRQGLRDRLRQVQNDRQQTRGHVEPGFFALKGYLDGYDLLGSSVGEGVNRLLFDPTSIRQHQRFVGTQGQEVYLRDMELQVPIPWLGENVEIADCQGSDSPNPLHFALLQQHLLGTHLVLYVISSRYGLREADFRLLEFIRTLRLDPHTLFVLNVDLDVHPDLEDIEAMCGRVKSELEWVVPDPQLFRFSALLHLADQVGDALPEKERRLLRHWKKEKALVRKSSQGFQGFRDRMAERIQRQRTDTLLRSILNRLSLVAGSVLDTVKTRKAFLDQDIEVLKESSGPLREKHASMQGMLLTLRNSISGLREALLQDLDGSADAFFHPTAGMIVPETMELVERFPMDPRVHRELTDLRQALRQLYRVYLEFREGITRFLVERINTRVIEFAREREAFLQARLQQAYESFWTLFQTAVEEYRGGLAQYGVSLEKFEGSRGWDGAFLGRIQPAPFSAAASRAVTRRGTLLLKFGLARLSGWLEDWKSSSGNRGWGGLSRSLTGTPKVVEEAVALIKAETRSELGQSFAAYAGDFKVRYLRRMLDQGISQLHDEFEMRSEMARLDWTHLVDRSRAAGEDRTVAREALIRAGQILEAMKEELDRWSDSPNPEEYPAEVPASREERPQGEPTAIR